ncbi:MAG TPA: alpha/beta hydrolase [Actinomycetes bacterium]|jgi:pimeloyl-ACP methyl ester carboxylesterase|nr:alpha/beta hydrolase [Actinomycetes bacterium]
MEQLTGVAGGVPYVALPPDGAPEEGAPLVVAWHLHDPPRSERAMAAALPLRGLPAWRVYLGLPLSGSRLPEGGLDAFFQLGYQDAVLKVLEPTCRQAVEEFPAALAALRQQLPLGEGPLGLLGGSVGALVALGVLAGTDLPVGAVALVSPAIRLTGVVAANERRFGVSYRWTEQSRAAAERLDFVARAEQIAKRDAAVLVVVGALDDEQGIRVPAEQLWQVLSRHAPDRTALTSIPEMAHALAEEPGLDPAPQTPHAARVDTIVAGWFHRHLTGSRSAS